MTDEEMRLWLCHIIYNQELMMWSMNGSKGKRPERPEWPGAPSD